MSSSLPDNSKRSQKVSLLIELHRWQEALAELGRILAESPGDYDALCQTSLCHFRLGEYQAAYDTTKTAIENGPEYEWAYRIQSHIFTANGEANRALDAARLCVEKAPYLFEAQLTLFYALIGYGSLSEARTTLPILGALAPDRAAAHIARGYYGLKVRDLDYAEAAFLRALGIEPDNVDAVNNLGSVYHEMFKQGRGGRYKKLSLEMFEKAVTAEPTFTQAQINIGLVKEKPVKRFPLAGIYAIFIFLATSPLQALLYVGFSSDGSLRELYKAAFSPSRGDTFIVVLNSAFVVLLGIAIYIFVVYLTLRDKKRFRERYSTTAFWKGFLVLNLGMIVMYCVALFEATSESNFFPGFAIRVFILGVVISIVRLVDLRQSEAVDHPVDEW